MNVFVLAAAIHFIVGNPQHGYPLRETMPVTNVPPAISVTGSNSISVRLTDREALWGLGERFDVWNLRGQVIESWTRDMAQGGPASSYFAVPFVISSEGWGLFVNCAGKARFDSRGDDLRVELPEDGIDAFWFRGTPREILAEYTKLVGRPALPPAWVFTPWLSRNSYLSAADVDRVIAKMEEHGLKGGVVVLEAWAESLQNFKFEEHRYPKPREWIARLHEQGYRIVLWETPSVWTSASTYGEAKSNGWIVLSEDGSEFVTDWLENGRKIDFRKPEARAWWTKLHEPLVAMGVDGFKTDGGERHPDPWFHNLNPFYYQRAVPSLTFARSASAPCAGNFLFWAGDQHADWNSLRRVVRAGLSAAMSGFPFWGHDIGGYTGTPTKKLYIRWLQLGAFSPIMQLHGISPREPWYYDDEIIRISQAYFKLREALQPYLLATAKQDGVPMWRPLAMDFCDDERAREIDDEFMLGDDLLVAPVLNEFDERRIYLPKGEWRDAWTGEPHIGPKSWLMTVDLDVTPVFVRNDRELSMQRTKRDELVLAGEANERGIVPAMRVWRGQQYEKVFLNLAGGGGEVSVDACPNFEVLPARQQTGDRVAFYVMWPKACEVGTYPVRAGSVALQFVKLPDWNRPVRPDGYVDLGSDDEAVAKFDSAEGGRRRLWVGSGDGIVVWLNDRKVFERSAYRSPEMDENSVDVDLKSGENLARVKIVHGKAAIGPNGFYFRISVPAGN